MPLSKVAKDAIFDIILKDALIESSNAEIDCDKNQNDKYEFSKDFERNIAHIKSSINRKDIIMTSFKTSAKIVVTAAAVMGVLFGGLLIVPSVKAEVVNVFKEVFSTHDKHTFNDDTKNSDEFDKEKRLNYVPEHYELSNIQYSFSFVQYIYDNYADGKFLCFDYSSSDSAYNFDNENREYRIHTENGQDYCIYESFDTDDIFTQIMWYNDGYIYSITAQVDADEIVKIAKSVK